MTLFDSLENNFQINLADSSIGIIVYSNEFIPKHEQFSFDGGRKNSVIIRDQAGHKFIKDSKEPNKKGEIRWTCQKRTSRKCKVVIKTMGDFIVSQKNDHTCYDF